MEPDSDGCHTGAPCSQYYFHRCLRTTDKCQLAAVYSIRGVVTLGVLTIKYTEDHTLVTTVDRHE